MPTTRNAVDRPQGMRESEGQVLCDLVRTRHCSKPLDIGMANGSSSVGLLRIVGQNGGGRLTEIGPYQFALVGSVGNDNNDGDGYSGEGVAGVARAGFGHMRSLMAKLDYIALPKLVERGEKFDFVFIDGYHSFDFVFADSFFANLLLSVGGVIACHDSSYLALYKVCRFIAGNKEYRLVGPHPEPMLSRFPAKLARRARYWLSGENAVLRECGVVCCLVAAYEKLRDSQCRQRVVRDF